MKYRIKTKLNKYREIRFFAQSRVFLIFWVTFLKTSSPTENEIGFCNLELALKAVEEEKVHNISEYEKKKNVKSFKSKVYKIN